MPQHIDLRYGMNPHQTPASVSVEVGRELPFQVLNGRAGYINLLDALKAWQIVRELSQQTNLPAATSLKHTNPVGAGLGLPPSTEVVAQYEAEGLELSPLAAAYLRARSGDPVAAYGDFIGLSHAVDAAAAAVIARYVSDGIIAPSYTPEALAVLARKKKGTYLVIEMDPRYEPISSEQHVLFGIRLRQPRNMTCISAEILNTRVTRNTEIPASAQRDLILATILVKYSQSNATCVAYEGQAVGVGVGQQSRIACTRIACDKADCWMLRNHSKVAALRFVPQLKLYQRDNAIDHFVRWDELSGRERDALLAQLQREPEPIDATERQNWLSRHSGLSLSSDGYVPFRDNLDRAARSGVRYVVQPGGSARDADVTAAANEHGMCMAHSRLRVFYH